MIARTLPPVTTLSEGYLRELIARDVSKHTFRSYSTHIRGWIVHCAKNGVELSSPTDQQCADWVALAYACEYASSTVEGRIAAVRGMYVWSTERGLTPRVPRFPRRANKESRLPRVLSVAQIELMLSKCDQETMHGRRRRALIEVLYATACRVSEAAFMKIDDIDFARRQARVFGKGRRERLVPLGDPAVRAIVGYLEMAARAPPGDPDREFLFTSREGRRLNPWAIRDEIRAAAKAAKLHTRVHPHMLRHACATHLLEGGMSLRSIQTILGHKSIVSTQRYTSVSHRRIHEEFDRVFPRARGDDVNGSGIR